jgi:23S rRNA (uracil1939-C5)-methyltransferase
VRSKKKNIILEKLLVADYAAEGKSLARVDGKVIFMENAIPGDIVDIKLTKNKKDWGEGFITGFHQYSPDRIKPFCSHFGVCGGCQWQMLPYEKQLFYKQKQVEDNLKRIGKISLPDILPIVGAETDKYYRNKIEYTFSNKRFLLQDELKNPDISAIQNAAGFHAKGIFDKVVDIDTCYLQSEPTNQLRKAVKKWGNENNVPFYDMYQHVGFLRTMQIRMCTTGELMVNIVYGYHDEEKIKSLSEYLLLSFPTITTLLYTINTKRNDSMHDLSPQVYFGKGYVIEKLSTQQGEDFYFKIGAKSFFQTNTKQAERLYQVTKDFAALTNIETIYDLYCGTGSIGIFLSRQAKKVIGVDVIAEAIEDAKQNAVFNKIDHAEFVAGDVVEICDDAFFHQHGKPDVIITDPPRAGMHEKLVRKILEMEAKKIVYVSCNPATQARDLNLLDEKYCLEKIQPVDMFPHTHHIENVALLIKR